MSGYTKGPWGTSGIRISGRGLQNERLLSVLRPDGASCAFVIYSDQTNEDHIQSHADQRLIAAAPEMYEALKQVASLRASIRTWANNRIPSWQTEDELFLRCEEALAKAEGK